MSFLSVATTYTKKVFVQLTKRSTVSFSTKKLISQSTQSSSKTTKSILINTKINSNNTNSNNKLPSLHTKTLLQLYPTLKQKIQHIQQDVFGYAPPSYNNQRTGYNKTLIKQLTGTYLAQYYDKDTMSITPFAQKLMPEYQDPMGERRQLKLKFLRIRGKGPPKKGSGKRKKKMGGKQQKEKDA